MMKPSSSLYLSRVIASSRPISAVPRSPLSSFVAINQARSTRTMSPSSSRSFSSSSSSHSPQSSSSPSSSTDIKPRPETQPIKQITVFGAGLMGAGIAQVGAVNGYQVILSDVTDTALQNGLSIIHKSLSRTSKKLAAKDESFDTKKWEEGVLGLIRVETDAEKAILNSDLVIEAIIENLKIKRELFKFLDGKASPECIFATNTSSLSVTEIAAGCSDERKTRFAGVHFFNPVPAMKLVEVIKTDRTTDKTFETLMEVSRKMGKAPVGCKDTPGFIVNRLLIPYMLDAIRMVERGEATPEDIDRAMELGAGYPMGPFKLLDFVGLDTTSHISSGWQEKAERGEISKDLVRPIPLLDKMIKEGRYGKKSGRGFYDYGSKL